MPEGQLKSLVVLQRGEVPGAHAHAQRLTEPGLSQATEQNDFRKAMPTHDQQSAAGQKRMLEITSPKKPPKKGDWGRAGRGTKTGSYGGKKPHYTHGGDDESEDEPASKWHRPNGKGNPKGKPKGKGKGKYGGGRGRGRGK